MSKVIKARFVIEDQNWKPRTAYGPYSSQALSPAADPVRESGHLTQEAAEEIYNDTKKMIEELMEDARNQAADLMFQAKASAQELIEKSQSEVENIKDQAYKLGYEQGYQAGKVQAEEDAASIRKQMRAVMEDLVLKKEEFLKEYEQEMVNLVILLTEKILGAAAEIKPEIINQIVKRVLREVGETERIIIKVNPIHIPYLDTFEDEQSNSLEKKIGIAEDSDLQPGECIVISDNGFIEAKIPQQLDILKQAMLDVTENA